MSKIVFYPESPISTNDPIGSKSEERNLLENKLSKDFANSMSGSLASNYLSEYGSNNRILYMGVGNILASFLVDILTYIDDSEYLELRSDFLLNKLIVFLFPNEKERLNIENETELKTLLVNLIKSLIAGAKESSILELLKTYDPLSEITINQTGVFFIECLTSSLAYTTESNGHYHLIFAKIDGLGRTSAPLGYKWGDDLHTHDVLDGVVQTNNGHTHNVIYGFKQDVITTQENLYKLLLKTKPAHVRIENKPSQIFNETPNQIDFDMSLALGFKVQEEMRKTDVGVGLSTIYGYAQSTQKNKIRVFDTSFKVNDRILVDGVIRKIISITTETPQDNNSIAYNFMRHSFIGTSTIENGILNTTTNFAEGEIVLIDQIAYYVEPLGWNGKTPNKQYLLKLSAKVLTLDLKLPTGGLKLIENVDLSYKTRSTRNGVYEKTFQVPTSSFYLPFNTPYRINGLPILKNQLVCTGGVIDSYDPITRKIILTSAVTSIKILYPLDNSDEITFGGLNGNQTLNNYRPLNQRPQNNTLPTYRGDRKNSMVLYKRKSLNPLIFDRVRSYISHHSSNTINNLSFTLNKNILNRATIVDNVNRVTNVATATANVIGKKITLPFRPLRIISVKVNNLDVPIFKVSGIRIELDYPDGTIVTVECLTEKSISQTGDWFRAEPLNESQIPFKDIGTQQIFDPDLIMDNPLLEPSQTILRETIQTNSGLRGEFNFYKDDLVLLRQEYNHINDVSRVFNLEPNSVYTEPVILSGADEDHDGILNSDKYLLNDYLLYSDKKDQVSILLITL